MIGRLQSEPKTCKQLIFWSLPIDEFILKRLIGLCSPEEIIIFGVNLNKQINLKDFLRQFLGFLKKENAPEIKFNLLSLAACFEVSERTCLAALNLLQESGILSFKFEQEEVKIMLFTSPSKVQLNTQPLQDSLLAEQKLKNNLLSSNFNLQCYKL